MSGLPKLPKHLEDVLRLIVAEYTVMAIAGALICSPKTVRAYIQDIKVRFAGQPELEEDSPYKTQTALRIIGKRYFNMDKPFNPYNTVDLTYLVELPYYDYTHIKKDKEISPLTFEPLTLLISKS